MSTEEADNQNNTESPSEKKNFFRIPQFKMPKINKKTMVSTFLRLSSCFLEKLEKFR